MIGGSTGATPRVTGRALVSGGGSAGSGASPASPGDAEGGRWRLGRRGALDPPGRGRSPGGGALGRVPPRGRPGAERQPWPSASEAGTTARHLAPAKGEGFASQVVDPHGSGRGAVSWAAPLQGATSPGESGDAARRPSKAARRTSWSRSRGQPRAARGSCGHAHHRRPATRVQPAPPPSGSTAGPGDRRAGARAHLRCAASATAWRSPTQPRPGMILGHEQGPADLDADGGLQRGRGRRCRVPEQPG